VLRPEVVLFEPELPELPELLPLPLEVLLLLEAVDLEPPEEDLLLVEPVLPDDALLSFAEVPLAVEPLLLLPDVEVLDEVLLLADPLPDDVEDLDPLLEVEPLLVDSLLELLSLGVPPVVRLVPLLLLEVPLLLLEAVERPPEVVDRLPEEERPLELEEAERPLAEVFWLDVFFD
jgi:hypothetical protein